jgi:hypothetical protein
MACTDKKFIEYIEKCRDNDKEGENMTYQEFTSKAERKYQRQILNREWNTPTHERSEIIDLKAKLAL